MARSYAKVVFFKQMCDDASHAVQIKDEKENMTHLTHLKDLLGKSVKSHEAEVHASFFAQPDASEYNWTPFLHG